MVVDSGGWNTVLTATANPGRATGHVLIHPVDKDGTVHFYDHLGADTGATTWAGRVHCGRCGDASNA